MIFSIVGTEKSAREKAYITLSKLGTISAHIYSEQIAMLEALVEASSLFGEKIIVNLLQVMGVAQSRDELLRLLPEMKVSPNIFIIDEPFGDANVFKKLEKVSEEIFDAREEKVKEGFPTAFLFAFEKRDKKNAWIKWMELSGMDREKLHGALWWKFQSIWSGTRDGRPSKFTLKECEEMGGKLLRAKILAHRGERDLGVEMEKIVLGL